MEISLNSTLLASSANLSRGRIGPRDLQVNGRLLVDEDDFFRAGSPVYEVRGGAGVQLLFTVEHVCASPEAAELFALTHWTQLPKSGALLCQLGAHALYLHGAVLDTITIEPARGLCVPVRYSLRGGLFASDAPPELPIAPGEAAVVMRRGKVAIAAGVSSVAVVFTAPLAVIPTVTPSISRPTGGDNITAILREDTVSTTGFTVDLTGETPNADFVLHYTAFE